MEIEKLCALIDDIEHYASEWLGAAAPGKLGDDPLNQAVRQGIRGAAGKTLETASNKADTSDKVIELLVSEGLLDSNTSSEDLEAAIEAKIHVLVNESGFIIHPLGRVKLEQIEQLLEIYGLKLTRLGWKWGTHETGMTHIKYAILDERNRRYSQFTVIVDRTPYRNFSPNVGFRRGYKPHGELVGAAQDALNLVTRLRKSKF